MKPAAILLLAIVAAGYLLGAYAIAVLLAVLLAALVAWAAYGARVEREIMPRYVTGETLLAGDRHARERRETVERWQAGGAGVVTKCEVCGTHVFVAWFSIFGDRRIKCGQCSKPRRAEVQRAFPDHDPGDEDRVERAPEPTS